MVKRKKAKQDYEELMDKIQKEVDQSNLISQKKKKKPKKKNKHNSAPGYIQVKAGL